MTTTAALLATFENLAASQRRNADEITALASAQGLPFEFVESTVSYLRETAAECEVAAQALRDGDAFSTDDIMGGGIEGPFVDNNGRPL